MTSVFQEHYGEILLLWLCSNSSLKSVTLRGYSKHMLCSYSTYTMYIQDVWDSNKSNSNADSC